MRMWKLGGARRSSTVFCVLRRRASSSPRVTASTPPTRSASNGLSSTFSSVWPWAVATSCTPRSAIVRAARASASVPISSTTTTSGMWFSTASIMTRCCRSGCATCMRRARPMPACGMSPSPAISFDVSTTTTRRSSSLAKTRAISRSIVVLPTPGGPSSSRLHREATMSATTCVVPCSARPGRMVSPTMLPERLRSAEKRCSVRAIPARLSAVKAPNGRHDLMQIVSRDLAVHKRHRPAIEPRFRTAAHVEHEFDERLPFRQGLQRVPHRGRQRGHEPVKLLAVRGRRMRYRPGGGRERSGWIFHGITQALHPAPRRAPGRPRARPRP